MKKVFLFAAILFAGVSVVMANDDGGSLPSKTADQKVDLRMILKPVHSITVNQGQVDIIYEDLNDYNNGSSSELQEKHITVSSTGSFDIFANAETKLANTNAVNDIELNLITIHAFNSSVDGFTKVDNQSVVLETESTDAKLLSSDYSGFDKSFDVTYEGASLKHLLNNEEAGGKYILNNEQTIHETKITYSLVPR